MVTDSVLLLFAGFVVNAISALLIVRGIYYQKRRDGSFIFTFLVFNTVIYFVMHLFTSIELSIGVGFGLFALFSVLRYRTETVPIREMTYLFVMVALPVMNSVFFRNGSYAILVLSNVCIIGVIWVLEKGWGWIYPQRQQVCYERVDLIHPSRRDELYADLETRLGRTILYHEVGSIDYLRDTADLVLYLDT
ncbi:MAG: DUF4956 domain-containing protein [Methanospirillaceae archaeon]|nr:DUF4956 domain-containing protein [Methanospirillaceae archaeon]